MKTQKRVWILASIFCAVSIAGLVLVQMHLDRLMSSRKQLKEKLIYIPEGRFLKTAAMGFDAAIADVLWARTVIYFGGHFVTDNDYRWLYSLLDATIFRDPNN